MGFLRPGSGAVLITEAQQSREQAMKTKQRRYSYTMAFRTVSFVVAVLLPIPVWAKVALLMGAIVIPWTAVTAANSPAKRQRSGMAADLGAKDPEPLQLDPATVIPGHVVHDPHSLNG